MQSLILMVFYFALMFAAYLWVRRMNPQGFIHGAKAWGSYVMVFGLTLLTIVIGFPQVYRLMPTLVEFGGWGNIWHDATRAGSEAGSDVVQIFNGSGGRGFNDPIAVQADRELLEQPAENAPTYIVKNGDTLNAIAAVFGTTANDLASLNGMSVNDYIHAGDVLVVDVRPTAVPTPEPSLSESYAALPTAVPTPEPPRDHSIQYDAIVAARASGDRARGEAIAFEILSESPEDAVALAVLEEIAWANGRMLRFVELGERRESGWYEVGNDAESAHYLGGFEYEVVDIERKPWSGVKWNQEVELLILSDGWLFHERIVAAVGHASRFGATRVGDVFYVYPTEGN